MNKNNKIILALLLIGLAISCKQSETDHVAEASIDKSEIAADSASVTSASAPLNKIFHKTKIPLNQRDFILLYMQRPVLSCS